MSPRFPLIATLLTTSLLLAGSARAADALPSLLPDDDVAARYISPVRPVSRVDSIGANTPFSPLRVVSGGRAKVRGSLELEPVSGLSVLCGNAFGVASALEEVAAHCLSSQLDPAPGLLPAASAGARLTASLEWVAPAAGLEFDFGLAWLAPVALEQPMATPRLDLFDPRFSPSAGLLGSLEGESAQLQATRWLSERSWLRVSGQHGRYRLNGGVGTLPAQWAQSGLQIDGGLGAFSGVLRGHRNSLGGAGRRSWTDFDLGVSWRTPWSGKISVGANNVLNSSARDGDSPTRAVNPDAELRTPYVRYQQDL